jgi:hypothetical protein
LALHEPRLNSSAAIRRNLLAMPTHQKHTMTNPTPAKEAPKGFWDRLFARLEFLMSKKTMDDRARR